MPKLTALNRIYEKNVEAYADNVDALETAYSEDIETIDKMFEGASRGLISISKGISDSGSTQESLNLLRSCQSIMESYQKFTGNLESNISSGNFSEESLKAYSVSREVEQNLGQICKYILESAEK